MSVTSTRYICEPGNSEYLEEFPLGFYWSSIRARVVQSVQFRLLEIGELGVGGPIYL
jgi:hypothetical protein